VSTKKPEILSCYQKGACCNKNVVQCSVMEGDIFDDSTNGAG
jgi:hypothetical protein